MALLINRSPC